MKSKNLLLLFTRNPELGKVKSRLAKDIGAEKALRIYKELMLHTKNISQNLEVDKWVYYSEKIAKNDIWEEIHYTKKLQEGADLGVRMEKGFLEGFRQGYENIIIIGSDIYDLQQFHIEEAFKKLENHETVIGPSEDGGYYLLGMKNFNKEVFKNKNWGTDSVLEDTLLNLKENYCLLETLNDIDVISDIKTDSYLHKIIQE